MVQCNPITNRFVRNDVEFIMGFSRISDVGRMNNQSVKQCPDMINLEIILGRNFSTYVRHQITLCKMFGITF